MDIGILGSCIDVTRSPIPDPRSPIPDPRSPVVDLCLSCYTSACVARSPLFVCYYTAQVIQPRIAAVYVIAITPGIVAFGFAQKLFFQGLMEGALKA